MAIRRRHLIDVSAPAPEYSFCEPVHATPTSRIHIRKVGPEGLKTGGGVPTPPLCGYDLAHGWDIPGTLSPRLVAAGLGAQIGPTCPTCANLWAEATGVTL